MCDLKSILFSASEKNWNCDQVLPGNSTFYSLNCMSGCMYPLCLCLSNIPCKVEIMAYCN